MAVDFFLWSMAASRFSKEPRRHKTLIPCRPRMLRSYNYRVVMRKNDATLDMKGRCSAGQRVLVRERVDHFDATPPSGPFIFPCFDNTVED